MMQGTQLNRRETVKSELFGSNDVGLMMLNRRAKGTLVVSWLEDGRRGKSVSVCVLRLEGLLE